MPRLLIIADDFTGALDTGVQLAKRGIDTLVAVMREGQVDLHARCQVLVVNTESRHIPPLEARARVAAVVQAAPAAGFTHLYKKTDSTLRGNIGTELAAMLENVAASELVFVPAFPKLGRFTIDGLQYVGKNLLSETAFADDPFNPIRQSGVSELIHEQTTLAVENIFLGEFDKLRQPVESADDCILRQPAEPAVDRPGEPITQTIRVVDARTDDDLASIGRILKEAGRLKILAGCAGFAELLPDMLELPASPVTPKSEPGGTLLVSGSVNPLSIAQVRYALDHCGYASSRLTVDQKIDAGFIDEAWEAHLTDLLSIAGKAAIWSQRAETAADDAQARAQALGIDTSHLGGLIAENIGAIVRRVLAHAAIGTMIVFGGDTLLGIADAIGCHLMRPVTEIVPGVALARFANDQLAMNVVTKAGGFGGEDVVGHVEQFLAQLGA